MKNFGSAGARLGFAGPDLSWFDTADTIHLLSWTDREFTTSSSAAEPVSPTIEEQVSFITGLNPDGTITDTSFWGVRDETAFKWGETVAGTGATITYSFEDASKFRNIEKATFEKGLATWSSIADITFVEAADPQSAQVVLRRGRDRGAYSDQTTTMGSGSTLGTIEGQAIISIDTRQVGFDLTGSLNKIGGYGFGTVVHEIGHMLGLGHSGDYNGAASPSFDQYSTYDRRMYTAMSYIGWYDKDQKYGDESLDGFTNWGRSEDRYYRAVPHGAMLLDIVAIQQLYGAPEETPFDGGQIYGFRSNIEGPLGDIYNFNRNPNPIVTLYNKGTDNTLNTSGFDMIQEIDLRPGEFSSIGGLYNNVAIAFGTVIETAIGGSSLDYIRASDVDSTLSGGDGDDSLTGGTGQDRLSGGAGADRFVFLSSDSSRRSATRADVITDFNADDGDIIDLAAIEAVPLAADSAFTFIGSDAFSGAQGELRVDYRSKYALVQGDIDGDGRIDFAIRVTGVELLEATDFAL